MEEINEETTCIITIDFLDENDAAVIPDSANWILYDSFSGTNRRIGTIGAPTSSYDLELTPDDNQILSVNSRYEVATLYVNFIYGGRTGKGEYSYKIMNLAKVE